MTMGRKKGPFCFVRDPDVDSEFDPRGCGIAVSRDAAMSSLWGEYKTQSRRAKAKDSHFMRLMWNCYGSLGPRFNLDAVYSIGCAWVAYSP